jgi:hypothetical protein
MIVYEGDLITHLRTDLKAHCVMGHKVQSRKPNPKLVLTVNPNFLTHCSLVDNTNHIQDSKCHWVVEPKFDVITIDCTMETFGTQLSIP